MSKELTKRNESEVSKTMETGKDSDYTYRPLIDIVENDSELLLFADMPGVDEKSVSIDMEGHELSISGTIAQATPEGRQLTYQEFVPANFERSFTLGNAIDRSKIKATVKDGVLKLVLPKAEEMQPKKITVVAG